MWNSLTVAALKRGPRIRDGLQSRDRRGAVVRLGMRDIKGEALGY